ncbi:SRPBCC family protein [Neobacillus niacini]|uniref:SRPBCC family protein n=1 Tax=Neobacillus niacini TaxID=86668 RepID=UPI002FFFD01F
METLTQIPVVTAEMLIRRPVEEVFEAFVDPAITTKFWFTKSSGRLAEGKRIRWDWEMYGVGDDLDVKKLDPNKEIRIVWSDGTQTEWVFTSRKDNETFVSITNTGFSGSGDEITAHAIDSMGGYTMVLCGLKALLEHNVVLNLVSDKAPDAIVNGFI